MDLGIVEKWQHSPQVELFYNNSQRKLVFKKYNYIYSKGVDDFHSYPYMDLKDFRTACFSVQENILAFQRNEEDLVIDKQEILVIDSSQHTIIRGKNRKILGYHWISDSNFSDLVVIDCNSVEFFKVSISPLKVTSVKAYPMALGHYWYSSAEGIVVVSLSPPKLGTFFTFFLNQNKGPKLFNGCRFSLDLSPCVTDKWTTSPSNTSSLTNLSELKEQNAPHSLTIATLYGVTYLLHVQSLTGLLKILQITYEKVEEVKKISLSKGQYGIRVVDNLIIMQNYTLQESYVIDIMSENYQEKPFCMFWNNMKETLPTINIKLRVFIEKPKVVVQSTFAYDGKQIKSISDFTGVNSLGGIATECIMPLNPLVIYVDNDICVDTKAGRCYKLQFSPLKVVENHPDQIESALFLFRRTGCKAQAFEFLKNCLKKYTHIRELSYFFEVTSQNYKNAVVEKKIEGPRKSVSMSKGDLYALRVSTSLEPELKMQDGKVVVSQSDMFSVLFQPLFEKNLIKADYLGKVLQEYIRSLISQDIDVQVSLQLLLARVLVKCGEFSSFQNLILCNAITDSYEMVGLLIQLIPENYSALQLSVDMLFRMRYHEKLVDIILDKNFLYETLVLLSKVSYPRFDIRKLLAKCEENNDEQMTLVVTQFIKEKSLS